jgi:hypothetical protein
MSKFESTAIPFVQIDNRQALTGDQMAQMPWLREFVARFPDCFEWPEYMDCVFLKTDWQGHRMKKSHPGFKAVQAKIQREGYSKAAAGGILAAATRNASKAAHKANPRLNRVKGK